MLMDDSLLMLKPFRLPNTDNRDQALPQETEAMALQVRHLRRKSRLRGLAERLLKEGPQPIEDATYLLNILTHPKGGKTKERQVAVWILGQAQLTPEQRSLCAVALMKSISMDLASTYTTRYCLRVSGILGLLAVTLILLGAFVFWIKGLPGDTDLFPIVLATICLLGAIAFFLASPIVLAGEVYRRPRFQSLVTALGNLRLPESLGILATAAVKSPSRETALAALRQVLPILPAGQYRLPFSEAVPSLCRLLGHKDEEVVLDMLGALEQIGDGQALRPVERLAETGRTAGIRAEARRILPVLQERAQQESAPKVLLRASQAAAPPPDTLLRPTAAGTMGPEQLLRAGQREEEP